MSDTVWFVVDDTNARLSYSGSWSLVPSLAPMAPAGSSGLPYNNTLHVTSDNSSIAFRFNGSSHLGVYGTSLSFDEITPIPKIRCFVDGNEILSPVNSGEADDSNNILACLQNSSSTISGEHELFINVTNFNSEWSLDYIIFESLVQPVLDGEVLQVGNGELSNPMNYSMLSFGPGWDEMGPNGISTSIVGSKAMVKFNGTSLLMYGSLSGNTSNTAAYQVDDQEPKTFLLVAPDAVDLGSNIPSPKFILTNQMLFNASGLSVGEHMVTVALNGNAMPLTIEYFYITSLTTVEQASLTSPVSFTSPASPSLSPTATLSPITTSHSNVRVVTGAIVGSVIALVVSVILVTAYWNRNKGMKERSTIVDSQLSFVPTHSLKIPPSKLQIMGAEPGYTSSTLENSVNQVGDSLNEGQIRNMELEQRLVVLQDHIQQLNIERTIAVTALQDMSEASTIDVAGELPPIYTVE